MIKSHKDRIKEKSIDLHRYYPDKYKKTHIMMFQKKWQIY